MITDILNLIPHYLDVQTLNTYAQTSHYYLKYISCCDFWKKLYPHFFYKKLSCTNLNEYIKLYQLYLKSKQYAHQTLLIYDIEQEISETMIVIDSNQQFVASNITSNLLTYIQLHQLSWHTTKITIKNNYESVVLAKEANASYKCVANRDTVLKILSYYYMDHHIVDQFGDSFITPISLKRKAIRLTLQKYKIMDQDL